VLLNLLKTGLCLAVLAAPAAAAASEPSSDDRVREAGATQQAPRVHRQAPIELICRSVEIAGGAEAAPMVCMSAAEWRRAEQ